MILQKILVSTHRLFQVLVDPESGAVETHAEDTARAGDGEGLRIVNISVSQSQRYGE
jgi:hypothetical protein